MSIIAIVWKDWFVLPLTSELKLLKPERDIKQSFEVKYIILSQVLQYVSIIKKLQKHVLCVN